MWTQWFVYVCVELPWAAPGEVWPEQLQGAGECSAFQIYRHSSGVRRSVLRRRSFRVGGAAWKVVKTEKPKMDGGRATNPAILRCCTWGPGHTDRRVLRKRRIEYDMVLFIWYELIWYFVYIDDMYIYIHNYIYICDCPGRVSQLSLPQGWLFHLIVNQYPEVTCGWLEPNVMAWRQQSYSCFTPQLAQSKEHRQWFYTGLSLLFDCEPMSLQTCGLHFV